MRRFQCADTQRRRNDISDGIRCNPFRTLFFLIFIVFISDLAAGDEFKLTPSVAIKEQYNDNILYTVKERQYDYLTTLSPMFSLTERTEKRDLNVSARLDDRLYARHSELNAKDQFYQGNFNYIGTPRFRFFTKAFYSQESSPDRDLEVAGFAMTTVRRDRQNYAVSGNYAISEKTSAILGYEYLYDRYENQQYDDLQSNSVGLGFVHDLSYFVNTTKARVNLRYSRYHYTSSDVNNYEGLLGFSRALSETWNILVDGGVHYVSSISSENIASPYAYSNTSQNMRYSSWGGVGQLTIDYQGERTSGKFTVSRDLKPASGIAGVTERTSAAFFIKRKFTYEFSGSLGAGYIFNKSGPGAFSNSMIDQETLSITPVFQYEFSKDMAFEASYTYSKTQYNITRTEADRNLFLVVFKIQHHMFE